MLQVNINSRGAIVFPYSICIDGHEEKCLIRIVTHIHSDHLLDLNKSISYSKFITATPITMDLLEILGFRFPLHKRLPLDYRSCIELEDAKLCFEYAHHIAGTAQTILETTKGLLVYTSDFKRPGKDTPVIRDTDIMVIDATYGDPRYRRVDEDIIVEKLVKLLRRLLTEKPIAIYAYYGKAQEVMQILRSYGVDAPFIASAKQWKVLQVLQKHGLHISDVVLDGTKEANEIRKSGWYILFHHHTKFYTMKKMRSMHHVLLSGWLFTNPIRALNGNSWIVGLSDHADFDELVSYVEEAKPRVLIVDAYRGGSAAYRFTEYVRNHLGIQSIAMPNYWNHSGSFADLNL